MFVLFCLIGAVTGTGATGVFAITGDSVSSLVTAALTTINTILLLYGQKRLRRVEPKLEEIHSATEHVQDVVDRRKLSRADPV